MKTLYFLPPTVVLLLLALITDATEAMPAETKNATSTSVRNRQLINSDVPTAATSVNGGGNPLQSLALLQQLQSTSGNNPMSMAAEMAAQNQEVAQLQTQKQQQSVLAAVQAQQQHVAAAQAALKHQNMANAQQAAVSGGALSSPATAAQSQQLQQQLQVQQQQLLAQQEILKQQVNPQTQQLSQKQILLAQLLSNPNSMNQAQLIEQIRQQQAKQQAGLLTQMQMAQQQQSGSIGSSLLQPSSGLGSLLQQSPITSLNDYIRKPSRLAMMNMAMYDPTMAGSAINPVTVMTASSARQQLLLQRLLQMQQQQEQMLLLQQQQQMAMMSPYMF